MPVTDVGLVKQWANTDLSSTRDGELDNAIVRAESWIESVTGRSITLAEYTEYYDGDEVHGDCYLVLNPAHRPLIYPSPAGNTAFSVEENGTVLTAGSGYDSTGTKVLVAVCNVDAAGQLYRPGGWSPGKQNIEVNYVAGWDGSTAPAAVVQLVNEVAWLIFNSYTWVGKQNVSHAGAAITWEKDLSPFAKQTLDSLRQNW